MTELREELRRVLNMHCAAPAPVVAEARIPWGKHCETEVCELAKRRHGETVCPPASCDREDDMRAGMKPDTTPDHDPRTSPEVGDVKEYADGCIWKWGANPLTVASMTAGDEHDAWQTEPEDKARWLTAAEWQAEQARMTTK
jgi:hypothetical protein